MSTLTLAATTSLRFGNREWMREGRLSGYFLAVHCEECLTSFQEQLPLIAAKRSGADVLALLHTDQPQIHNRNVKKISSNLDLFDTLYQIMLKFNTIWQRLQSIS